MQTTRALRPLLRCARPAHAARAAWRPPVAPVFAFPRRHESSASTPAPPRPLTDRSDSAPAAPAQPREEQPAYQMTFTCKACSHRSSHRVSKQAYHHGTTLITCPGCKNRHLISDHLKIFSDKSVTLEDILEEKGQYLKKGTLEGDVEFWDDGTETKRG